MILCQIYDSCKHSLIIYYINSKREEIKNMNDKREKYRINFKPELDLDVSSEIFFESSMTGPDISNGIGAVKISVYDSEKEIPHFHVWNEAKNFWCSIKFNTAEYFIHDKYVDTLKPKQIKILVKFLEEPCAKPDAPKDITNWDYLKIQWNRSKNNIAKCTEDEMPDYKTGLKYRK